MMKTFGRRWRPSSKVVLWLYEIIVKSITFYGIFVGWKLVELTASVGTLEFSITLISFQNTWIARSPSLALPVASLLTNLRGRQGREGLAGVEGR